MKSCFIHNNPPSPSYSIYWNIISWFLVGSWNHRKYPIGSDFRIIWFENWVWLSRLEARLAFHAFRIVNSKQRNMLVRWEVFAYSRTGLFELFDVFVTNFGCCEPICGLSFYCPHFAPYSTPLSRYNSITGDLAFLQYPIPFQRVSCRLWQLLDDLFLQKGPSNDSHHTRQLLPISPFL